MKPFERTLRRALAWLCTASMISVMIGCDAAPSDTTDTAPDTTGTAAVTEADTLSPEEEAALAMYSDPDWAGENQIIELDGDWPSIYIDPTSAQTAEASMDDYFSYMFDKNVTDIVLAIYEQSSQVPTESDAISWMYEKCTWTEEGGLPVNYDQFSLFNNGNTFNEYYQLFTESDTDMYAMAFEKIREAGIRPWMSFRMNDRHATDEKTSYLRSKFLYEAKENGYMVGSEYGFHRICIDFSEERVRQVMYDYLREMILRYDVFGIQLDFMRCMVCFDYLHDTDYQHYMTEFIRDIHGVVEEAEAKFGHDIKLMLRLGRSIEHNMVFGFDVETIVAEKLVDALVPSPRWDYSDSPLPVAEWKALAGDDIAVFAGIEQNRYNTFAMDEQKSNAGVTMTRNYVKGYSAGYYAQGADGVYFNNFFQLGSNGPSIWDLTREDMTQGVRRYTLTGQDLAPIGYDAYKPLPLVLKTEGAALTVSMGEIRPTETVSVLVLLNKDKIEQAEANGMQALPDITLNGVAAASVRKTDTDDSFFEEGSVIHSRLRAKRSQLVVYTFEGVETAGDLVINFSADHDDLGTVDYLELLVEPK